MSDAVGIDLGTSHACVAVVVDGVPRVVPTRRGTLIEPACVAFGRKGPIFGEEAQRASIEIPEATIFSFIRLLGRKFYSPEVDWLRACSPYDVIAAPNGDAMVHARGRDFSVQEVVSYLIEHLKARAELELERPIRTATIAIPANFDELQRRAVVHAARLAGLDDCELVHATTAAATQWASESETDQCLCLLSFGGGCFEVSLVNAGPKGVEVLATTGDPMLGGDDIDRRLVMRFLDHFQEEKGLDAAEDPKALAALFELARRVKHELTDKPRTGNLEVSLGALGTFEHRSFSRRQLVELIAQELAGLKEPCRWAFEDAGLGTDDIHDVIALGGGMRMPAVKSVVKYLFRTEGTAMPNETTAVAMGAARIAHNRALAAAESSVAIPVHDIAVHSTGIKVRGGRFLPVVPRRMPMPCVIPKAFSSGAQSRVVFELYQGENDLATENVYLGRITLDNIHQGQFNVSFGLDDSGMLSVGQVDANGQRLPLDIQFAGGLTEDEMTVLSAQREDRGLPSSVPADSSGRSRPSTLRLQRGNAGGAATRKKQVKRTRRGSEDDLEQPLRQTAARKVPSVLPKPPEAKLSKPPPPPKRSKPALKETAASAGNKKPPPPPKRSPPPPPKRNKPGKAESLETPAISVRPALETPPQPPPDPNAIEVGADSLVGTVLGERYLIEEIIGEGGMGRVYLAQHKLLGKRFAIKVLHPELAANRELAERFVREARAASSIESDHVVDISDFGLLADGTGYFVMEHLDGKNLEERLDDEGPQSADVTRRIAVQVADAIRGAHAEKIVHRDLKPSNIVLAERKGKDFCKILDFGIAKSPTSDSGTGQTLVTQVGVMMGTPHYMAPEQIDGEVDPRSDIYALGIVMFEMLAGNPPFDAESIAELLAKQKWSAPPKVHEAYVDADCPPELEAIVRKCLEKKPEDRFQDASEVIVALEELATKTAAEA